MKILAVCLMVVGFGGCCHCPKNNYKIGWTGSEIAVGVGDKYYHNVGWIAGKELGLREDGVLVWREMKP